MSSSAPARNERTIAGLPPGVAFFYLFLFSAALIIYGIAWSNSMVIAADTPGYFEAARDLADLNLDQLNDRPPGYPLLLLLTGASSHPTRRLFFTALLLHLVTIWMLSVVLHNMGLNGLWLKLFGSILILPPYVQSCAMIMTESLAQFCLALTVACFIIWLRNRRTIYLVITSSAIGYSALTRPTYQALSLVIVLSVLPLAGYLGCLNRREMIRAALSLIAVSAILVGGLSAFNYSRFGYFGITPLLGYNLSTRTVRFWDRLSDNEDRVVKDVLIKTRDSELISPGSSHTGLQSIYAARPEIIRLTGMSRIEASRYLVRMNLNLIMRAPLNYLQEVGCALGGSYWFPANSSLANMNSRVIQMIWSLLHFMIIGCFLTTGLFLSGALADSFLKARLTELDPSPLPSETKYQILTYCLAGTIVIYTMIISCAIDIGDPRFRLPTDCLILLMVFLAPMLWMRLAKNHRNETANRQTG